LARRYSPLVSWLARGKRIVLRHRTTFNSPGTLSTAGCTGGNPKGLGPLPSVDDIAAIAENITMENAISIAQREIECLEELSLEGDVPDDMSEEE
jgi:hypothetical protein